MNKLKAISILRGIRCGDGVDRTKFPESMKGEIAKDVWNDSLFTLGIEYGAMIALMDAFEITEGNLIKPTIKTGDFVTKFGDDEHIVIEVIGKDTIVTVCTKPPRNGLFVVGDYETNFSKRWIRIKGVFEK